MSHPAQPTLSQRVRVWLIDGALLGLFMVSVGVFVPLIEYPAWPVRDAVESDLLRRLLIGLAMGLTAVALIYSPWGGRSGAHMNPAVTLTFLRLGKIKPLDAVGYIAAQFIGGALGVVLVAQLMGPAFSGEPIRFAPTRPGHAGVGVALAAEFTMTFILMTVVLHASNRARFARVTGLFAGALVALFITVEAPLSGMSLNPARTIASALPGSMFDALWVYFTGPLLGMLAAAEFYRRTRGLPQVHCCKLNHDHADTCIHCGCDGPIQFDQHPEKN